MSVVSELRALAVELEGEAGHYSRNPDAAGMLRHAAQRARLRALRAETSVECRTDERPRFAQLRAPQRPQTVPEPKIGDVVEVQAAGGGAWGRRIVCGFDFWRGRFDLNRDSGDSMRWRWPAKSWPDLVEELLGPGCSPEEMVRRAKEAALRLSQFADPKPPRAAPPAELMTHRVLDESGSAEELVRQHAEVVGVKGADGRPTFQRLVTVRHRGVGHVHPEALPPDCEHYTCAGCGAAGVWHRGVLSPPPGVVPRRLCSACRDKEPTC